MDTGSVLKPAANAAQKGDTRPESSARTPVTTELSPAKTVTAAADAAPIQANEDARQRDIILDPHSREVIYRAVDALSRRVMRQPPEEAKLRLRAYARATREKKNRKSTFDTTA